MQLSVSLTKYYQNPNKTFGSNIFVANILVAYRSLCPSKDECIEGKYTTLHAVVTTQ